eukprot:CAMPEP_0172437008 /NCGR_PEP_ID=MMETSP1064-20121228/72025_1 /TAXON_ID=202472 /ORGANISM="Aulacoseira subarctica , Strain CCAP 1002/5" /LENGTH=1483 /DNA_ID=CAMNT_0013185441 /DNA_START=124 /DNA_END=4576 /DNA_ORIENTATION=-
MILNRGGSSLNINTSSSTTTENGDVQLTPKKLSIETKDQRRLVEYFVVVSSVLQADSPNKSPANDDNGSQWNFQPMITSRYPLTDHADNALCDITDFCHPSGNIQHSDEFQMPKVHYFVVTSSRGQLMYGTCLTMFEPYTLPVLKVLYDDEGNSLTRTEKKHVYLPKCICLLSAWPYLAAFREYLTQLHRLTTSGTMSLPIERYITNFCAEIPAPPPGSFEVQTTIANSVIKLWSPPYNQPIAWVSLPFSHLFQCLDLHNIMVVWHALALERQILITSTQLSLLTTCCEILSSLLFPMRWSHAYIPVLPHFMRGILNAPFPYLCGIDKSNLPAALMELSPECIVVDLDKNYVSFGPMTPPLPALPLQHNSTFHKKLDDAAGMVFKEVRCLNRSHDTGNMGLNLPSHVKDVADASWEGTLSLFDEAFHLYFTPEESRKNLLNGDAPDYAQNFDTMDSNVPLHIRVMSRTERQKLKRQSNWDAVQEAFLSTYVYMLRNYRKFLVFPSKQEPDPNNPTSQEESTANYGGAGFKTSQFIRSQRYDMQPFLRQLCATQQFDNFITKRLYGSGEADVIFFDMAIDKLNAGDSGRRGTPLPGKEPLLQSAGVRRKLKTIVPPEPYAGDLPDQSLEMKQAVADFRENEGSPSNHEDDISVISTSSAGSYGARSVLSGGGRSVLSGGGTARKKREEESVYIYATFPETLNEKLYASPRPLPSAVLVEFDRQRENAARFRRKSMHMTDDGNASGALQIGGRELEIHPFPEVATFTLFFMTFTSLIGKELLEVADKPSYSEDHTILSSVFSNEEATEDGETSTLNTATSRDTEEKKMELEDLSRKSETHLQKLASAVDEKSVESEDEFKELDSASSDSAEINKLADSVQDVSVTQDEVENINELGTSQQQPEVENDPENSENCTPKTEGSTALEENNGDSTEKLTPQLANDEEVVIDTHIEENDDKESICLTQTEDQDTVLPDCEGNTPVPDAVPEDAKTTADAVADSENGHASKDESNEKAPESIGEDLPHNNISIVTDTDSHEGDTYDQNCSESDTPIIGEQASIQGSTEEVKSQGSGRKIAMPRIFREVSSRSIQSLKILSKSLTSTSLTTQILESEPSSHLQSKSHDVRSRFTDKLSALELEEAKATAKAQVDLAFEILHMMRERGLKADPSVYQCLIEACGRCGDTDHATLLLSRMHDDGIVADGVVYACLVSAFSAENAWKKKIGQTTDHLPEWANGVTLEMDWNSLRQRSLVTATRNRMSSFSKFISEGLADEDQEQTKGVAGLGRRTGNLISSLRGKRNTKPNTETKAKEPKEMVVTEPVLMQILLGENLLELVYPDIVIEMNAEACPRCNRRMSDAEIVSGWKSSDPNNYTTTCPSCTQKFVPHFSVQSTSPSFVGSRGASSPLYCERLSPWVLQKELRSVMSDKSKRDAFLQPEWREKESRNATIWWNLVVSFMRYRLPVSFLMQGNFQTSLIGPTPSCEELST